jgi:CheY-like chemotaxis protein
LREAVSDLLVHTLGGLVNIEWQVEKGVWDAFADQAQLELALLNLIINGRDAMPGGGTLTIAAHNSQLGADDVQGLPAGGTVTILAENRKVAAGELPVIAAGDYVLLSVMDTGTGISADDLEKVMEPFFTTKDVGKGSGLGLSMVYGFATQSNGAFRIESELGSGTTAELWLPRAPAEQRKTSRATGDKPRQRPSRKLRLLLVDDHVEVRTTTAAVLEDLGHTVEQASNGAEALEALKTRQCDFDVLISDYAMPHLSGTDFLREAREICPDVPALIITGYAEADAIGDRPQGIEVLLKPFTAAKLEDLLARVSTAHAVAS